jgi:hypothetical protein
MTLAQTLQANRHAKAAKLAARASKSAGRMVFNKDAGVMMFHTAMAKTMVGETTEADQRELITGPLAHLEELRTGGLSEVGFIELNESNVAGFCLAAELHKTGNTETRALLAPTEATFQAAANALADIGERKNRMGKFVVRAEELQALRESFDMYGQLIAVAPRGYVCRALQEAARLVQAKLDERGVV